MISQWSKAETGFSKASVYGLLGIHRQAVHQREQRLKAKRRHQDELMEQALDIRSRHPRMGSRPMFYLLEDPAMGITAFERLMSVRNMTVPTHKKHIVTTHARQDRRFANLIYGLVLRDINQLVVGDITYWRNRSGLYYVYSLKDMYSKRLVGLVGSDNLKSIHALTCFTQLKKLRNTEVLPGMIHHTDAGTQYRSDEYLQCLKNAQVLISEAANCLENGAAEQCHHTIKNQYLLAEKVQSVSQLNRALSKIKRLINHDRPVKALNHQTPAAYEKSLVNIPMDQRPIVKCHNFRDENPNRGFLRHLLQEY